MINLTFYIILLVAFWFLGLGGLYFFPISWRSYIKNYILVSAYFITLSFFAIYSFALVLDPIYLKLTFFPLIIYIVFSMLNFLEYFFSRKILEIPVKLIEKYSDVPFLRMDYRYLISKSFEIFYQQILIVVLVYLLSLQGLNMYTITLIFIALFGFGHMPILKAYKRNLFGILIFLAALFSAFFFPYIILNFKYGFVYTYILHLFFYTNAGLLFWLTNQVKSRKLKM